MESKSLQSTNSKFCAQIFNIDFSINNFQLYEMTITCVDLNLQILRVNLNVLQLKGHSIKGPLITFVTLKNY